MSRTPSTGDRVLDRYELADRIGDGGFAEVFRAVDTETGEDAAVKCPNYDGSRNDADIIDEYFGKEATTLAQIRSAGGSLARRYGVAGRVVRGSVSAPLLPFLGATVPGILVLSYVWVQTFASLIVRIQRPDVSRTEIRAGQRYPQVIQPGNSRQLVMGTAPSGKDADADPTVAGTDGGQTADPAGEQAGVPEPETHDRFGQTKVFTPPDEKAGDAASLGEDGPTVKNELCPICVATYVADAGRTQCPNCNAVLDEE